MVTYDASINIIIIVVLSPRGSLLLYSILKVKSRIFYVYEEC